jgi:hypothetical protein
MNLSAQIAKHFRDVHFGGNWTSVSLKEVLADMSWQQATMKVQDFNTIAVLVYHTNYYVDMQIKVLQGGPLEGSDKLSFECLTISSEEDWQRLVEKTFKDAETLARLIEGLPESKLGEVFVQEKYGMYYRNLQGCIEHLHYHLGQMVLIKRMVIRN